MTQGALAGKTLTYISAGSDDACALDTRGKAYCWGADGDDELGNGETSNSKVRVAAFAGGALAGTTLTQISTDGYHSCALDTAGAVICWGDNNFGELGENSVTLSAEPVLAGPHAPPACARHLAKPRRPCPGPPPRTRTVQRRPVTQPPLSPAGGL